MFGTEIKAQGERGDGDGGGTPPVTLGLTQRQTLHAEGQEVWVNLKLCREVDGCSLQSLQDERRPDSDHGSFNMRISDMLHASHTRLSIFKHTSNERKYSCLIIYQLLSDKDASSWRNRPIKQSVNYKKDTQRWRWCWKMKAQPQLTPFSFFSMNAMLACLLLGVRYPDSSWIGGVGWSTRSTCSFKCRSYKPNRVPCESLAGFLLWSVCINAVNDYWWHIRSSKGHLIL